MICRKMLRDFTYSNKTYNCLFLKKFYKKILSIDKDIPLQIQCVLGIDQKFYQVKNDAWVDMLHSCIQRLY